MQEWRLRKQLKSCPDNVTPDDIIKFVEDGGDINELLYSVMRASMRPPFKSLKLLVEGGANVAQVYEHRSPFHHAAAYYNFEVLQYFLEVCDHAKDIPGQDGFTPLMAACQWFANDKAVLLLDAGADCRAKTDEGETALHYAAEHGDQELVIILIKHGAEVNATDNKGNTALHRAVTHGKWGSMSAAATLVRNGANVDAQNELQQTALGLAVASDWTHMAEVLLANGADPRIGPDADNPIRLAGRGKQEEFLKKCAQWLESRGLDTAEWGLTDYLSPRHLPPGETGPEATERKEDKGLN